MSRVVLNLGCHPASYWSYSAEVISRALSDALQNNGIIGTIPINVLGNARQLFKITLGQTTGGSTIDHISAQLHTQVMAWRWFDVVYQGTTKKEFLEGMQKFLSLLERLSHSESTVLNPDEQKITARHLIVFYYKLRQEADEDRLRPREVDE